MESRSEKCNTPEILDEERRARLLRFLTDLTEQRLYVEGMNLREAREAVAGLRRAALRLFPEGGGVFDLVIAPRMERVISERFFPRERMN
jgi:hypothetical protein